QNKRQERAKAGRRSNFKSSRLLFSTINKQHASNNTTTLSLPAPPFTSTGPNLISLPGAEVPCHAISSSRRHPSYIDSVYVNVDIQHPSPPITTIFHREQASGALLSSQSYSPHLTYSLTHHQICLQQEQPDELSRTKMQTLAPSG
ncbi:hypothetical protein KC352_g45637, partial [Hortaea werneckii]